MKKYFTAIAKDDLEMGPHSWEKGLDYQLIEAGDYYKLASNEGHTNITSNNREKLDDLFEIQEGWRVLK